jgi:hypothetical protein
LDCAIARVCCAKTISDDGEIKAQRQLAKCSSRRAWFQRQVNILDPQKGHSVGFKKCLNLAREHCGFTDTQAGVFRVVDSLRDGEQRWLMNATVL